MINKAIGAYWKKLGPGLTTGAADDDPSGIATYSQAGAGKGFGFLWMAVFTFPFLVVAQEMCARIGIVTKKGLAANIRENFSKSTLYFITILLFAANSFNIGANLSAMAAAVNLILPTIPSFFLVIAFAIASLYFQVFVSYAKYSKILKWLALAILAYVISAFILPIDWKDVLYSTLIPTISFTSENIFIIAAILGTTISPYLFFWQTSQEVEEKILNGNSLIVEGKKISAEAEEKMEMKNMQTDVVSGMFISNLVMFFIIVVCGATLFPQGITQIDSAADAAAALKPLAGHWAYLLFTFGIIGSGLLSIPVLAGSTAYSVSESMKWKFGLYHKLHEAYAFYGVIAFSMFVGIVLNFVGLNPIMALLYSAVINCIVAPIILVLILLIANNKKIMGNHSNGLISKILGLILIIMMSVVSISILATLF